MAEREQGLRAVQLEGKNMDSVECCVCVSVGGGEEGGKVRRRSGEQENSVWCVSWCGGDA